MTLSRLIGEFVLRHWRAYVASAFMLVGVAVFTVWIPRKVGSLIDGLAAYSGQSLLDNGARRMRALTGYDRVTMICGD